VIPHPATSYFTKRPASVAIHRGEKYFVILFLRNPRHYRGIGRLRDMQNRLVDHEEFSAQRCFYHDAVVPINENPVSPR